MGLSSGGFTGSKDIISNMGGGIPITGGNSGDASSTTHAAVSDGTITIRDTDKQQQNVADLSRDAEHANNALSPIFDKEKEQNRLREINLIGEIGNQVGDIARAQGKIAEEKALKDPQAIQAAKEVLAENGNLTPTQEQLTNQIRNTASASYGTGSDLQRAIQAATAVTQGLTGGNLVQALAGGSAPYLAHEISKYLPADQNQTANLMAHAVLGAVVGHFNGNATVGAVSAFTAEAAAPAIIKAMGWDKDHLTEQQKQTVSALGTLAAGLVGGLVGDSSNNAVAGAQAGKNALENNALSFGNGLESVGAANASWNQYAVDHNLTPEEAQAGLDNIAKGDMPDSTNITKVIVDGYQDGVMIAGAWYLGPAASVGKVVGGGLLGLAANSGYQSYDLNQPQNANKSWDYLGSATSFTTGMLAPGREMLANTGIAMGGAFFTDGANAASLVGAGIGAGLGGAFGKFGPFSGEVNDIFGAFGGEFISNEVKDAGTKQ
ncbi:hypothetical protein CBW58_23355 [Yersinia frederiksenii]|nr:hypothetical protein CBW58_23355 [Yersinia frederiksenii]